MYELNTHIHFARRGCFRSIGWMLGLFFLTYRHMVFGEQVRLIGNDPLTLLLLVGSCMSIYFQKLERSEQEAQPKLIEKPDPKVLSHWMEKSFTALLPVVCLRIALSLLAKLFFPHQMREVTIALNVCLILCLIVLGAIYFESSVGYRNTDKPLAEKDKLQAKHLIYWIAIHGMSAVTLFAICSTDSKSPEFWPDFALISLPTSFLIPVAFVYAGGLYLMWDRLRNETKRGGNFDLFAQTTTNLGKALIIQCSIPIIHPYLVPHAPVWALQGYFLLISGLATVVPFLLVSADVHRKILVTSLNRIQALLIFYFAGAVAAHHIIEYFNDFSAFLYMHFAGFAVAIWGLYQHRLKEAGKACL